MAHTSLVTPSMTARDTSSLQSNESVQRKIASPADGLLTDIAAAPAATPAAEQSDSERFMRIVQATGAVASHYDLFIFLQSKVQHFIPHQIMIAAWGDFRGDSPKFDVVSALPGVRTDVLADCGIEHMLRNCFHRYISGAGSAGQHAARRGSPRQLRLRTACGDEEYAFDHRVWRAQRAR